MSWSQYGWRTAAECNGIRRHGKLRATVYDGTAIVRGRRMTAYEATCYGYGRSTAGGWRRSPHVCMQARICAMHARRISARISTVECASRRISVHLGASGRALRLRRGNLITTLLLRSDSYNRRAGTEEEGRGHPLLLRRARGAILVAPLPVHPGRGAGRRWGGGWWLWSRWRSVADTSSPALASSPDDGRGSCAVACGLHAILMIFATQHAMKDYTL